MNAEHEPVLHPDAAAASRAGRARDRLRFAGRYAAVHLLISLVIALAAAIVVFVWWYPAPYRQMLDIDRIFLLLLAVDAVCGPLLTLILASPGKSRRERWLDFTIIGAIQLAALAYGMHSVWAARPVALAFEVDRLVLVTANEVQIDSLPKAPSGLQRLRWAGVVKVGTRKAANSDEYLRSVELGLGGISPAMQPDWWIPWKDAREGARQRARPLAELISRQPSAAQTLEHAAHDTGHAVPDLAYLPLVSSKTLDWVALLDGGMNMVGWAPVDGF